MRIGSNGAMMLLFMTISGCSDFVLEEFLDGEVDCCEDLVGFLRVDPIVDGKDRAEILANFRIRVLHAFQNHSVQCAEMLLDGRRWQLIENVCEIHGDLRSNLLTL